MKTFNKQSFNICALGHGYFLVAFLVIMSLRNRFMKRNYYKIIWILNVVICGLVIKNHVLLKIAFYDIYKLLDHFILFVSFLQYFYMQWVYFYLNILSVKRILIHNAVDILMIILRPQCCFSGIVHVIPWIRVIWSL